MALGAQRVQVLQLILRQGVTIGAWGIAVGMAGAYGCTRLMASLLYGVSPRDSLVFWGVAAGLTTLMAVASSGPAWRASLLDPLIALRHE